LPCKTPCSAGQSPSLPLLSVSLAPLVSTRFHPTHLVFS
jgi:hypothetical protein